MKIDTKIPHSLSIKLSAIARSVAKQNAVPAFKTACNPIELAINIIVDGEQCYPITRTVCTESIEKIDNEICTYSYQQMTESTTAKTVKVTFKKGV